MQVSELKLGEPRFLKGSRLEPSPLQCQAQDEHDLCVPHV